MKRFTKRRLLTLTVLLTLCALVFLIRRNGVGGQATSQAIAASAKNARPAALVDEGSNSQKPATSEVQIPAPANGVGLPVSQSQSPVAVGRVNVSQTSESETSESSATQRMIMAHSSLRAAEETNPDSASNRKICEEMISKALRSKAEAQ